MSSKQTPVPQAQLSSDMFGMFGPAMDYAIDAAQRTVLFWDVMRQRGNQYREHMAESVPNVLNYEAELIIDGRTLKRPVNYGLVRIVPPQDVEIDMNRRPFIVIDPLSARILTLGAGLPSGPTTLPSIYVRLLSVTFTSALPASCWVTSCA